MDMPESALPSSADVIAAARRIEGHAHRTPVMTSRTLDQRLGARVHIKCENLQRVGAFKFRGAYNALSRLDEAGRRAGVVAFSSGNHAQAIALAGSLLEIPVTIVMPEDAPPAKMAATRGYGGDIVTYDRYTGDREAIARDLAQGAGRTLLPSFDHPDIIAGQGTAALELFEEAGPLDAVFVPLGGGGLLAGSVLAAEMLAPECHLYGVEPAAGDDVRRSLQAGKRIGIDTPRTIADGAQTTLVGALTFPIIQRGVREVLTVEDEALIECMRFAATRLKLVVEPTGCLGLAAAMARAPELRGLRVGVILSGGNVDMARYSALLAD